MSATPLIRLLQLASPALPVGAYSYSQGMEWAVESGRVNNEASAHEWIAGTLRASPAGFEAPLLAAMMDAWTKDDAARVRTLNDAFLASRESAELRAETLQMGYSLARLAHEVSAWDAATLAPLDALDSPSYPLVWSFLAVQADIAPQEALLAYLWAWLENQAMAALKLVPLGQAAGQRLMWRIGGDIPALVDAVLACDDDEWDDGLNAFAPALAIATCRHETQYSRLFRS
jgi:urease accessory protein